MKFIADAMLGRLAKWLRLMGYDTLYYSNKSDSELLRIGRQDSRVILTRNTLLMLRREVKKGKNKALFVKSEHLFSQVEQVLKEFDIEPDFNKTRCKYDNTGLIKVSKEEVKGKVPPYVYETQDEFVKCDNCQRIYWKATQWQDIEQRLENLGLN